MNKLTLTFFILFVAACSVIMMYRSDIEDYNYIKENHLSKIGATAGYGSYNLRSYDAGKTWHILKPAPKKLLDHLDAFDRLEQRFKKQGTIKKLDADAIDILKKIGFTVEKIKNTRKSN